MAPRSFVVRERTKETADTWTLALAPLAGEQPEIDPGQFVMVYVFGVGEVPISVSARPLVLTVRAVGAVSRAICEREPGDVLGIRGPFGNVWPIAECDGADVVVIAGGIGLAPLRPVVHGALLQRGRYGEVVLLYGARTPGDLLYTDELASWRGAAAVHTTVDAAGPEWTGKVGFVPQLLSRAEFDGDSTAAFVCGPEIMMRLSAEALIERGVAAERIFVSLERNMRCGLGHCGHCQLGPTLICRDGAVYSYEVAKPWLEVREL
jgi:NAD(P)H-flavin reductase